VELEQSCDMLSKLGKPSSSKLPNFSLTAQMKQYRLKRYCEEGLIDVEKLQMTRVDSCELLI
jgi:hypothetical protein